MSSQKSSSSRTAPTSFDAVEDRIPRDRNAPDRDGEQCCRDGRRFLVPVHRRLTWDLMVFNRQVPLCGHDCQMDLTSVMQARRASAIRISWPAVFLKAFSLVARDVPELRQTWYRWPWAHLYQHGKSCAALTVQREFRNAAWLFWGLIEHPDELSLTAIQQHIDHFCTGQPRRVFRRQYQLARLPTILRRLIWWWNLNVATAGRARRLGTFFLSTLSGKGVEIQVPPSIHTGCLTFGPLNERGVCRVTLAYDHRIMDGMRVAEILQRLDSVLNTQMVQELRQINSSSDDETADTTANAA